MQNQLIGLESGDVSDNPAQGVNIVRSATGEIHQHAAVQRVRPVVNVQKRQAQVLGIKFVRDAQQLEQGDHAVPES